MRFKSLVSGILTGALLIGAPGLPCWQACAQVMVKARVAGAPYKMGYVPGMQLPRSLKLAPFKSFTLTPNLGPDLALAPSVVLQNGVALPQTVLPVSAVAGVAAGPVSEQVSATFFQTLQTLGAGLAQDAVKNGGTAMDEKLAQSFDGSLGKKAADSLVETKQPVRFSRSSLKRRATLLAASSVLAVPAFSQTAQAAAEQPSSLGPVLVVGLAAVGLSLFVYNMVQAATGRQRQRALEGDWRRDYSELTAALGARDRLQTRLKDVPGAKVAALTAAGRFELVVYFTDKTEFERAVVPSEFEGLSVRKDERSAESLAKMFGEPPAPKTAERRRGGKLDGWLAPLLTAGLTLGSSAAAKAQNAASMSSSSDASLFFGALAVWTWGYLLFDKDFWWCWAAAIIVAMGAAPWWLVIPLLMVFAPKRK